MEIHLYHISNCYKKKKPGIIVYIILYQVYMYQFDGDLSNHILQCMEKISEGYLIGYHQHNQHWLTWWVVYCAIHEETPSHIFYRKNTQFWFENMGFDLENQSEKKLRKYISTIIYIYIGMYLYIYICIYIYTYTHNTLA